MFFYLTITCGEYNTKTSGLYLFADNVCAAIDKAKQIYEATNIDDCHVSISLNSQHEEIKSKDKGIKRE